MQEQFIVLIKLIIQAVTYMYSISPQRFWIGFFAKEHGMNDELREQNHCRNPEDFDYFFFYDFVLIALKLLIIKWYCLDSIFVYNM